MTWAIYPYFAFAAIVFWGMSGIAALYKKRSASTLFLIIGIAIFATFIGILWHSLQRPPLRTMGETRLWYAFFLAIAGLFVYHHWKYRWAPLFTGILASVFTLINILRPEIQSVTIMPALQSPWFIPHVTVYILSYAMLGVATITAVVLTAQRIKHKEPNPSLNALMDDTIYIGFGLLMLGLISGAIWAKEAWGNYWDWDPKETWAFITAVAYLIIIHMRLTPRYAHIAIGFVPIAFVLLMMAWVGVNYLPSATNSIHLEYSQNTTD